VVAREVYVPVSVFDDPGRSSPRHNWVSQSRVDRHPRQFVAPLEEQQVPIAASGLGPDLSERS
jgi:hypothetical protein